MMTVCKCQTLAAAGRSLDPRVKLMVVIVASVSIDPLHVWTVQNVLAPLERFHYCSPAADDQSDK
jgi:hypothetical protein